MLVVYPFYTMSEKPSPIKILYIVQLINKYIFCISTLVEFFKNHLYKNKFSP